MTTFVSLAQTSTTKKIDQNLLLKAAYIGGIDVYAFISSMTVLPEKKDGTKSGNTVTSIKNVRLVIPPGAIDDIQLLGLKSIEVRFFEDPEQPDLIFYPVNDASKILVPLQKLLLYVYDSQLPKVLENLRNIRTGIHADTDVLESMKNAGRKLRETPFKSEYDPLIQLRAKQYAESEWRKTKRLPKKWSIAEYLQNTFQEYAALERDSIARRFNYEEIKKELGKC